MVVDRSWLAKIASFKLGKYRSLPRLDGIGWHSYPTTMTNDIRQLSLKQLKAAIRIREKIEVLTAKLTGIFGSDHAAVAAPWKRRRMSAAGRAAIRAGQKARWAKAKGKKPAGKRRRRMSAAGRARIAAAARRRWKAAKAAGRTKL